MPSIRSFFVAALASGVLCACADDPAAGGLASAQLELASTPTGVYCLVVVASAGGKTGQWGLALTPGTSSTTLELDDVPIGHTKFEAAAYTAACADNGPSTTDSPAWVASATFVDVLAGRANPIHLVLHPPGGSVDGDVAFQVPVVDVALGELASYAVLANGQAYGWGEGKDGQLGTPDDNATRFRPTLIPGLPAVTAIAAGRFHACAIAAADKSVWCWGNGYSGQLGVVDSPGNPPAEKAPTKVNLPKQPDPMNPGVMVPGTAAALAAGETHTCALLTTGKISCWGGLYSLISPAGKQLTPSAATSVGSFEGTFIDVRAGGPSTCALLATGAARCWSLTGSAPTGPVDMFLNSIAEGPTAMVNVASFGITRLGVRADGQVITWTRSGADAPSAVTSIAGLTDAVDIAITAPTMGTSQDRPFSSHVCALRENGTVKCWGANASQGQLGNGTGEGSATPVAVDGLTNAVKIAVGRNRSCAIVEDGSLYCWGQNVFGTLGLGDQVSRFVPTRVTF